jgi:tetratricopeptide (TPR) repeat protein
MEIIRATNPPGATRFELEVIRHPADPLIAQAENEVASGNYRAAAAAYSRAIEQGRLTPSNALCLAILRLASHDTEGYRAIARMLLPHYGSELAPDVANTIAWTCALGPAAVADYAPAIELAEQAVASSPQTYRLNTLGALLYRAGRFDEAHARLQQALARHGSGGTADDWVFLAMTEAKRGNHEDARRWLQKIDEALEDNNAQLRTLGRAPWRQTLGLELLHAEVRALIDAIDSPSRSPEACVRQSSAVRASYP